LRVTIVGAGAIGGLVGGYMLRAGHDVTLVDRSAEHVAAMNRNGVFVDGIRGDMHLPARAITPDQLKGPLEAVIIAVKSMDTEDAARLVIPHLGPDGFIVSFQNGLHEPVIAGLLDAAGLDGKARVVGAIPNYGCGQIEPGHLEFVHEGPIEIGEMNGEVSERVTTLAKMCEALTDVDISRNIWGMIWSKEVYNNQVVCSALANAPLAETLGTPRIARLAGALVREAIGVAKAEGVKLEPFRFFDPALYDPRTPEHSQRLVDHIGQAAWLLRKDQNPSKHQFKKKGSGTWWDIKVRKRKSEVGWRNERIAQRGRAAGVDMRLTEKLCAMIHEIEDGKREFSFANYDELEAYTASIGRSLP
jgi:2-dehydropantoate 2-reductase